MEEGDNDISTLESHKYFSNLPSAGQWSDHDYQSTRAAIRRDEFTRNLRAIRSVADDPEFKDTVGTEKLSILE